jgi:hypothetical protein
MIAGQPQAAISVTDGINLDPARPLSELSMGPQTDSRERPIILPHTRGALID